MSDALQLLCDLSEASDQAFRDNAVEPQWRDSLNVLVGLGAIEPGPPPHTIACSDCDDDHPAVIDTTPSGDASVIPAAKRIRLAG